MGILLSILQSIFNYLRDIVEDKYRLVPDQNGSIRSGQMPTTHSACRSLNLHKLTTYQSRIDKLKADQIVYVSINLTLLFTPFN